MRKKIVVIIVATLIVSVCTVQRVHSVVLLDLFSFTLTESYLETTDPTHPLTYEATITNLSAMVPLSNLNMGGVMLYIPPELGALTLEPGLPSFLNPGESWTGAFATFDFYDWETPEKVQPMQFWVSGWQGWNFETEFKDASAGLAVAPIPEPSSLLLLSCGLFGLAGYRGFRLRRRKKA